ncbi:MAG: glycosyltransferase [Anaerolineae bacterium]|nr:glycosyltransferase [Anaerolineae bacterium]
MSNALPPAPSITTAGSDTPLVSICIPAYNAERTLGRTLDSLLKQTYANIEIIVSDNHSTDATRPLIESYAGRGVRGVTPPQPKDWLAGQPNYIGAYENCNFVLSQARGAFIALYHADDLYQPEIVQREVAFLQAHPQAGMVFTMSRRIGADDRPLDLPVTRLPKALAGQALFGFADLFNALLLHGNFLPTPSAMFRAGIFQTVGYFTEQDFKTSSDLEMWLRVSRHYPVGVIDQPLLNYRISAQQGGFVYHRLRTAPADNLHVYDHYLDQPGVPALTHPQALAKHRLYQSTDKIYRARNLLTQGEVQPARALLDEALAPRHSLRTLLTQPLLARRLLMGVLLRASLAVGLGAALSRWLNAWYLRRMQRRLRLE